MKCVDCRENLWAYLEHDVSEDMAQQIQQHLQTCQSCQEELKWTQNMMQTLRDLPDEPLPEGFHAELMQKIKAEAKQNNVVSFPKAKSKNWKNFGLVAAAVLLVAAVGGLQGIQQMRQPYDAVIAEANRPVPIQQEEPKTEAHTEQIRTLQDTPDTQTYRAVEPKEQTTKQEIPQQPMTKKENSMPKKQVVSTQDTKAQQPMQVFHDAPPQATSIEPVESGQDAPQLMTNRANVQEFETEYVTLTVKNQQTALEDIQKVAENLSLEAVVTENQVTVSLSYQQKTDFYTALKEMGDLTIDAEVTEPMQSEDIVQVQITCQPQI